MSEMAAILSMFEANSRKQNLKQRKKSRMISDRGSESESSYPDDEKKHHCTNWMAT